MRTIGVVTVSRSDYGIYLPILRRIEEESELELRLYVGGMHLAPQFGYTAQWIEADGYEIAGRVEMLEVSDEPEGISKSIGRGVIGFAQCYAEGAPDILMVLGDRFEMFAAAAAA
ncbi:UDP-N-acetylglucosamine 2-epimerase, partial [Candidatus Bipolaricaulota bacterium]|nr:UDP-N-acetylglucosamine 2-epimerase [Candidatus Bipolaricaulota bacterium]